MVLNERRRPRWVRPFFGLTDKYQIQLHSLLFDLSDRIEWMTLYEMPVHYRNFCIRKLLNVREKEKEQYDKALGKQELGSSNNQMVRGPAINNNNRFS